MPTIVIHGIDDDVYTRLQVQAARHGRSMEAEARAILAERLESIDEPGGLGTSIHSRFADLDEGFALELPSRQGTPRAAEFE